DVGGVLLPPAGAERVAARAGGRQRVLPTAAVPAVGRLLREAGGRAVRGVVPAGDRGQLRDRGRRPVGRRAARDGPPPAGLAALEAAADREPMDRRPRGVPAADLRRLRRLPDRADLLAEAEEPVAPD